MQHPVDVRLPCEADPDLFFTEDGTYEDRRMYGTGVTDEHVEAAKHMCATCDFEQDCLDLALDQNEHYGIWGGTTPDERRRLRRRRQRSTRPAA
ncbi:WhiB family transcriptional regulator [Actinomadura rudentiformis]|uniref:WhiB family transcriptional regulator n=1 Tax=Actinomadura rudentiformis TaxID=359158 RepID=UPI00178C2AF9|nr:WhiB family transcriptional regulator [Actinomadura rudentiformis]